MANTAFHMDGSTLVLELSGHIDSNNTPEVEQEITAIRQANPAEKLVIDCTDLNYVSSAGLRVILRLKKEQPDLVIINVSSEVFEIFDVTGFTEMMEIHKAFRKLSIEGCEIIGRGANGTVYRYDPETIVKVYHNPDALPEIQRERELARAAFVLGIPTAIPFDIVSVEGGGYGSVYEMLNARTFADLLESGEMDIDEAAERSITLLKQIHSTVTKPGTMPDMKETALNWAVFLKDYLPEELSGKLCSLVEEVPSDLHMLHGDYHLKNILLQDGESVLIDMDTICCGHPVFELASMFNAYKGFSDADHQAVMDFLGIPYEKTTVIWDKCLRKYLGTDDEEKLRQVEEKAMIIGFTRIMRRTIRRNGLNTEDGRKVIDNARKHLEELIPKTDTLLF